jgi:hypothetical protein
MQTEIFIQPRFVGARFEGRKFPISAAKDLAAYERLLVGLAKHLVKRKHGKSRVPKGFFDGFELNLSHVDQGSACPALVVVISGTLLTAIPPEVTEAKILINSVIESGARGEFPAEFPKEFYTYFNRIGCSLREDEHIEWTPKDANKTLLNQTIRKRLVLAYKETYEDKVDVVGRVEELDSKAKTGALRAEGNAKIMFAFSDPFFNELKEALRSPSQFVRMKGIGVFNVNKNLETINVIEETDTITHYPLVKRVEKLEKLQRGWHEGRGEALNKKRLDWLLGKVVLFYPEGLPYPSVVPTEEGNVIFEWMQPDSTVELEFNFSASQLEFYASKGKNEFLEETFKETQMEKAFARISAFLQS